MKKKKSHEHGGMVFSTDPAFTFDEDIVQEDTLEPGKQKLWISLDRKQRAGKEVTLVSGFMGSLEDLKLLGKSLRNACGTGGSEKDGEIVLQGDHRKKIQEFLVKIGYPARVR